MTNVLLDMPSIHELLTERMFWLGHRLASVSLAIYSFRISVADDTPPDTSSHPSSGCIGADCQTPGTSDQPST